MLLLFMMILVYLDYFYHLKLIYKSYYLNAFSAELWIFNWLTNVFQSFLQRQQKPPNFFKSIVKRNFLVLDLIIFNINKRILFSVKKIF